MNSEYNLLVIYFFISFFFTLLLFLGSLILVYQQPLSEKSSSYECGFNSFFDARFQFDVRFYIVGLLFLIPDLELMFLFPRIVVFWKLTFLGFFVMVFFLILLVIGFVYEISKGCLNWR